MPIKRRLANKYLAEKYKGWKDLENGLSNKDINTKYGVPRNTVSWKKQIQINSFVGKKRMNSSWTPHADDWFKSLEEELDNLLKLD